MKTCEEFEMLASAFVDDELDRDETVRLLDHMATCDGCRYFYGQARSLEEGLAGSPVVPVVTGQAWQRIESRVQPRVRRVVPLIPAWGLRAAAGIVLAVLVWQVARIRFTPIEKAQLTEAQSSEAQPIDSVSLEESRGSMDDSRFIELTSEILRADRRYHQAMFQVMSEVNRATGVERVSEESISSEGEAGERDVERVQGEVES